jgi:hypothetical protein
MVLEDLSTPDFDSDSSPLSDSDLYSDVGRSEAPRLHFNVSSEKLHKPFLPSDADGNIDPRVIGIINLELDRFAKAIQRPLTEDEATALAESHSKLLRTMSLATPFGFIAGISRAYTTRKSFKFPFWPATEPRRFNRDQFLFFKGGMIPRMIWSGLRFSAYTTVGIFTASLVFRSYAQSVRNVSDQRDPRLSSLRDLTKDLVRKNLQTAVESRRRPSQSQMTRDRMSSPDGLQTSSELWRNHRASIGDTEDSRLQKDEDAMVSDQQLTEQEAQQLATPQKTRVQARSSVWNRQRDENQSTSFDADDASPTAGYFGDASDHELEKPRQSAWERIRKRENPSAGSPRNGSTPGRVEESSGDTTREAWSRNRGTAAREQRTRSSTAEDYAFSNSEEERQLAQDEAQKSFDKRVERERRGGDFGGNEKGGRWS